VLSRVSRTMPEWPGRARIGPRLHRVRRLVPTEGAGEK
jgi:hypothetical protein